MVKSKTKDGDEYWVDSTLIPIKNAQGKIWQYVAIRHEITARKRIEKELVESKEAAENATKTKAMFLANMSHEIRTPMNGIIGISNLLLSSTTDPIIVDRLKIIQNCGAALLELINDVLDFSKLEVDKVELENESYPLQATVHEIVELFNTRASEKGLTISYTPDPSTPQWIKGDVVRFRQILNNLISNAIKFTGDGKIDISSQARQANETFWDIQFSVKDSGIGIPKAAQSKLFQSFSQVDASTTRRFGGSGLGLAITKGLCEKMGGRIWVESEVGQGSIFSFTFQAGMTSEITPPRYNTLAHLDPMLANKHPLRILVAEDNPTNQLVISGFLGKLGYRADIANNGKEALKYIENKSYDLVLMDCHMPEMDGFEATQQIIALYGSKNRPRIVAITASTMKEDINRCKAAGMDDFLSKPITLHSLVKALTECSKKAKQAA